MRVKRSKGKGRARGWRRGEFLVGVTLGLVLALWVYPRLAQWWNGESSPPTGVLSPTARPRFDFYDILERGEEVVDEAPAAANRSPAPPEPDASAQQSADAASPPSADGAGQAAASATPDAAASQPQPRALETVTAPGLYVLQLGAFTRRQEAEALKARLAMVGMSARIQPVRVDRQTWYRVRIGPYKELAQLNADRARLQEHRFDSMLLRLVQ